MRLRIVLWLVLAALAGCDESRQKPPVPEAMRPDHGAWDARLAVEITGTFHPVIRSDFTGGQGSGLDSTFVAVLVRTTGIAGDPIALEEISFDEDKLYAFVPAGIPLGAYDLVVTAPDGLKGTLRGAYRAVTSAENVDHFRIDPVGPQRAGVPFAVHFTALDTEGRRVEGFDGPARISDTTGTLEVAETNFERGRLRSEMVVSQPSAATVITIEDDLGHRTASDPFEVLPGLPVTVSLTSVPESLVAGECSPALEVALLDGFGQPAEVDPARPIALSADPAGLAFFSDDTCSASLAALALDPADATARFHVRGERAGPVVLRLAPEQAPGVIHPLEVNPGAPVGLAFVRAPRLAGLGACSAALEVAAIDAFGNRSPPPATVSLEVRTEGGRAAFFADASCTTPAPQLSLGGTEASAVFHLQAAEEGRIAVQASAGGSSLLPATWTLLVTP